MTKVYLVTTGEYSEYAVNGVFSTRERAQRLVNALDYYPQIAEFELDEYGDAPIRRRWDVLIYPPTSEILEVRDQGIFQSESPRVVEQPNYPYTVITEFLGTAGTFSAKITVYRAVVYAETEDKAKKIATDAVAKFKAEKAGL